MLTDHALDQFARTSISPSPGLIARANTISTQVYGKVAIVLERQAGEYIIAIIRNHTVHTFLARRVSQFDDDDYTYSRNRKSMHVDSVKFLLDD